MLLCQGAAYPILPYEMHYHSFIAYFCLLSEQSSTDLSGRQVVNEK